MKRTTTPREQVKAFLRVMLCARWNDDQLPTANDLCSTAADMIPLRTPAGQELERIESTPDGWAELVLEVVRDLRGDYLRIDGKWKRKRRLLG